MDVAFEQLPIWNQKKVSQQLSWYLPVSVNKMPAKFLICKRIPVEININDSEDALWQKHSKATEDFLKLWQEIRTGTKNLLDIPVASTPFSLLDLNVLLAQRMLKSCIFCEWLCNVDRRGLEPGKLGACQLENESRVASYFHHPGEELVFRGTKGSGTIFFTSCNMRCGFCQNGDISTDKENGQIVTPELVAAMAWQLRIEGCHNVNFVGGDPTIHLHTIIEAIKLLSQSRPTRSHLIEILPVKSDFFAYNTLPSTAQYQGEFNVPILWNSNFFMSEKTMRLLRTVIDIWLPDFKFSNNKCSIKLSRTPKYIETVTRNHLLLQQWNEDLVIRHLIMPNHVECCSREIFQWLQKNMPDTLVNVMDQYHPDCFANPISEKYKPRYDEINRTPTNKEIQEAYSYAKQYQLNFEEITFEKSRNRLGF